MKKTVFFFGICLVCIITLFGCASRSKALVVTEVLEHKGSMWGVAQPKWVDVVMATPNQKTLTKELGIDKHIWVLARSGENLDFLQTWVDQVDARAEIAASIKQVVIDTVNASLESESKETVEKALERYSDRGAIITIAGLNKETEWWTRTRSRFDQESDYEIKYNYLVIYSLDEELYQKQIETAFKDLGDEETTIKIIERLNEMTEIRVKN
ncbi:MAG: hypothetical protein MJ184_11975 [Treponema sp.]|uniref:hypothetical protein n=1 Tax=Treponema sp. TaxID=166 RepID=UPI00298DE096|nr:hypothetical protein [Treponema sp.]MCQ2602068.1 hypothetical protein [Treponema sp.]